MSPEAGAASRPILVAGAHGQVGRALMRRGPAAVRPLIGLARADLDIADAGAARARLTALRPALIINAAAYTAVDKAESEPDLAFAANRDGAANLAAVCAELGIPLLHLSTDYVFDGCKSGPYLETDAKAPLGVYGASKAAGEAAIRARLPRHIILRTAWVYGPDGANFVRTMLRLSAERPRLRVVDDQHGGPTPAGAIADALLSIAAAWDRGAEAWGTYHYCGAPAVSWCGFARAIVAAAAAHRGTTVPVVPIATADYPTPARRPANSMLDCARIARDFGIPQPDWRGDLPACVAALLRG
jgi:dTDP-4-dehydrorhamnose reductase